MKMFIALLSLHCISSYAFADEVFVDFEDSAIAKANFVGLNQGFYFIDPYGGRGDSGAISTNWYTRQNYIGKSFDFSKVNTSITVSTFFKLSISDPVSYQYGRTYGEVYLVPSSSEFRGVNQAFVSFGSSYPSGGHLSDNIFGGSLAAPGGSFPGFSHDYLPGTFKPGFWYELKVTFTNLGAMIRYEIMINEYDAGGLNFIQNVVHSTETTVDSFGLTNDTEVFAGFEFELSGAKVADDFSISATGQKACEGMYTQSELDQSVANAVSQAEASKDLIIEEKKQKIVALEESISILQAEVGARDALLAAKEAIINQLKDELDDLQRSHPHNKGNKHKSNK
jgi:hypothetical protein